MASLKGGFAAFLMVFAAGFALGTLRVLVVVPRFGETSAVLLELPVMLAVSWFAVRWSVRRFAVPATVPSRFLMGGVAFGLLMLAELAVSVVAFGRTPAQHLATYRETQALLGLAAQLAFAAMPLVMQRRA